MNMIILENPYVSDFLVETIKKNNFKVLDNEISKKYFDETFLLSNSDALKCDLIYSNSENSINWVIDNYKNKPIADMIELSKDKTLFREALKSIYPNYFFKKVSLNELCSIDSCKLKFPVVLKPNVGFLSFGVYPIYNEKNWTEVICKIKNDIKKIEGIFPKNVVNTSSFIIEQMIQGEEYALDAYFNENGEAVILNIFHHPFFDENDVSDRVYYTSKKILKTYLEKFKLLLDKIGKCGNYKNFPFHLELRVNGDEIIPIELNPMRFCGWCITDIAYYCWKINVYDYFINQKKPDWDSIITNSSDDYFYFTIADIPSSIERKNIKEIDFSAYLKNISNVLDIRKIDYIKNPIFAIVFGSTNSIDEIKNILKLDMKDFIKYNLMDY